MTPGVGALVLLAAPSIVTYRSGDLDRAFLVERRTAGRIAACRIIAAGAAMIGHGWAGAFRCRACPAPAAPG